MMASFFKRRTRIRARRPQTTPISFERLEGRRLLAGRRPIANPDEYEVDAGNTLTVNEVPSRWSTRLFEDFEGEISSDWPEGPIETSPSGTRRFFGPFKNEDVIVELNDLPDRIDVALTTRFLLRIEFEVIIIGPWEGIGSSSGRDSWRSRFTDGDEETLVDTTFANWFGDEDATQLFPNGFGDRDQVLHPPGTGAASVNDLGYAGGDSTYHFDFVVRHRSEQLRLTFSGRNLETEIEKSWGIDNVRVSIPSYLPPETGVLANDTDCDDVFIQAELVEPPIYGALSLLPDGRFTYEPDEGFMGLDTFVYRATDGELSSHPVEVKIAVSADGAVPPRGRHDSFRTPVNVPLGARTPLQAPIEVFFDDFEGEPSPAWSSQELAVTPIGERSFLGRFGEDEVRLALSDLAPHDEVTVEFDLFIINSWDGDPSSLGERWILTADDDTTLVDTSFSTHRPQSFPDDLGDVSHPPRTGASEVDSLGFRDFFGTGDVYRISRTFPHAGESLTLSFRGEHVQGLRDESWGLDNVRVFTGSSSVLRDDAVTDRRAARVELMKPPTNGTLTLDEFGQFHYVPNADFVGTDAFEYRVEEGGLFSNIGHVEIEVFLPDHAAAHDAFFVDEDETLSAPGLGDEQAAVVVFEDKFNDGISEPWLSVDFGRLSEPYGGFLGNFADDEASFEIDGLPVHSRLALEFDVYTFDTWDGHEQITIVEEHSGRITSFSIGRLVRSTDPSSTREKAGVEVASTASNSVAVEWSSLGSITDDQFHAVEAHRVRIGFPHRGDSARVFFLGENTQGIEDESWGLDNVSLTAKQGLLANDRIEREIEAIVVLESGPNHGKISIESNGAFSYVPEAGFVGVDHFVYRIESNGNAVSEATVRIDVLPDETLLSGDANRDGEVDLLDFAALKESFGTRSGWEGGDFDWSGVSDLLDFVILKSAFSSEDG